jgi:tripartite-type tricarboxylate transporter receptor subunit TctC
MKRALSLLAGCALFGAAGFVAAQSFPAKPIQVIVPYAPGASTDAMSRMVQNRLGELLGQPLVVENRSGAGGAIGSDFVARAAPDGYTIMFTPGTDLMLRRYLLKEPSADAEKDFTPIAVVVMSVAGIAAKSSAPFTTAKEMIDYAKRNPGKLTFGSSGINTNFHLAGELMRQHGINLIHVPFKGSGPSAIALVAGQVDMMFSDFGSVVALVKDGRASAIAVFDQRYSGMPDIPSIRELLPGFNLPAAWFGYLGPARMPPAVVQRLHDEIDRAFSTPGIKEKIETRTVNVISRTPQQFAEMIREGMEVYGKIVKIANIQPE